MPICKLCCDREANQTGSHILSWFLIRDAVNNKGKRQRHNEVSFEISSDTFVNTYFGSAVLPEDIETIKGRELTDEEIAAQKNHYTEDYILCTECEKRLATLESYISKNVFDKLRAHKVKEKYSYEVLEFSEKEAIRIFIYSLAWRASIVNYGHFTMMPDHEERLRIILNSCLEIDEAAMLKNAKESSIKICELPVIASLLETIDENNNSIFCLETTRHYAIIANDFAFQLFFRERHSKNVEHSLFGINKIIAKQKVLNFKEDKFKVAILNDEKRKIVYGKLYSFIADKIMRSALSVFRVGFKRIFKKTAPLGLVTYFQHKATIISIDNVERYSPEHFRNIAADVMMEYIVFVETAMAQQQAMLQRRWYL